MENIVIDSNVVISMIKYNEFNIKYNDIELLKQKLEYDFNKLKNMSQKFIKQMEENEDFQSKTKGLEISRIEKLKLFRDYCTKTKTPFEHNAFNMFTQDLDNLKAGQIFLKSLEGEVSLHIVLSSYKEVLNHVDIERKNKNEISISGEALDRFTSKHITLISVHNHEISMIIENLSEAFVEEKTGKQPMPKEINSNGRYGDAYIMAEANLAGMNVITQNVKHYIGKRYSFNKKGKLTDNTEKNRRKHIETVIERGKYTTDALPYTQDEFLTPGRCKQPQTSKFQFYEQEQIGERKFAKIVEIAK